MRGVEKWAAVTLWAAVKKAGQYARVCSAVGGAGSIPPLAALPTVHVTASDAYQAGIVCPTCVNVHSDSAQPPAAQQMESAPCQRARGLHPKRECTAVLALDQPPIATLAGLESQYLHCSSMSEGAPPPEELVETIVEQGKPHAGRHIKVATIQLVPPLVPPGPAASSPMAAWQLLAAAAPAAVRQRCAAWHADRSSRHTASLEPRSALASF